MAPRLFERHLESQRRSVAQRRARKAAEERRIEEIKEREALEDQRILRLASRGRSDLSELPARSRSIPSGDARIAPLPGTQQESYGAHLEELIRQASQHPDESEAHTDDTRETRERCLKAERMLAARPPLRALSDRLCGMCKEGSCTDGADHAYLSVVTIRRFMDANPQLSADAVLVAWVGPDDLLPVDADPDARG